VVNECVNNCAVSFIRLSKPLDHFLQVGHMFFIVICMFLKFEHN